MSHLVLCVGLPRSGKSTWAKNQGFPIVNPDAIRLALHGLPYLQSAEGFVWEIAYTMANALFLAGHEYVIVDATNITEKRRDVWKDKFPEAEIHYQVFPLSAASCIERAKADERKDLIPVIERMAENADYSC